MDIALCGMSRLGKSVARSALNLIQPLPYSSRADLLGNPSAGPETHQSTGVDRHLQVLREEDSADSLAKKDQIDVGVFDPLQTGLGLFDPLPAVSPGPALRSACPGSARAGYTPNGFSMFQIHRRCIIRVGPR